MCERVFIVFFWWLIFVMPSYCQGKDSTKTYQLPEIAVTANRFNVEILEIPTSLEIIDQKRINNSNGNRLSDVLKNSHKVFIKSYGTSPLLQTVSMNGLGAEHTLILIDGIKLNSFQNSVIDLSLINLENIDRIEILNNGSSSIYGSDAIGGVINIITNNSNNLDTTENIRLKLSLAKGSFNTDKYYFQISKNFERFNSLVSFNREKSDGNFKYEFDDGLTKQIKERENAAYKIYDIFLKMGYIFNSATTVKYFSSFANHNKQIPGIETGTPPAITTQLDKNWNNVLLIENEFSSFAYLIGKLNYQNNLMYYKIEPLINSHYKNLVYSVSTDLNLKLNDISTVAGIEFVKASVKSNEIESGAIRNLLSFYFSSNLNMFNSFKIYPSSRLDIYSDINEKVFTYKLGLNYQPFHKIKFSLKANIGKNYRAPTFNDLYWKGVGNKNLRPEKSFNGEIGLYYEFETFIDGFIDLSYTHITAKDKIVWFPQRNFIWMPINIAESVSRNYFFSLGINEKISEEISLVFTGGISLISSLKTNQNFQGDPTKDKYFPYIPIESTKFSLMFEYRSIKLNLFFNHNDKRYSDFENKKALSPYNTLDGNLSANISLFEILTEMKLEVNNILNTNYQIIPGYPMPLRNFKITLSINY